MSSKKIIYTEKLHEKSYEDWNKLVARSAQGSIYSTPEYLDALCSTAGGQFEILGCYRGDELAGGIGLYKTDSLLGGHVSYRTLLYYNGVVLKLYNSRYPFKQTSRNLEIMVALENAISRANYSRVLFHNRSTLDDLRPFISKGWNAWPSYTYVVPVSNLDILWSRMEQNQRRLIKRCQKNDVKILFNEDFKSFYKLHKDNHLRKGAPLYLPEKDYRRFFIKLKSQNLVRLYHVVLPEGRSIAAQLVLLGRHPVSHTVCAAADPAYLNIGATPFLRWKAFEDLSLLGYRDNDLTSAPLTTVTRFKAQLGGDLQTTFILANSGSNLYRLGRKASRILNKFQQVPGKVTANFKIRNIKL